jgi:hypothetical protein
MVTVRVMFASFVNVKLHTVFMNVIECREVSVYGAHTNTHDYITHIAADHRRGLGFDVGVGGMRCEPDDGARSVR